MNLPIRSDLSGKTPYGAPIADVPARLNVNENPFTPPPAVVEAVSAAVNETLQQANRYPDRNAVKLRRSIADFLGSGLSYEQIWPANGSNEVMHHIFATFGGPNSTVLSFSPTYSMYPEYARESFSDFVTEPRAEGFEVRLDQVREALDRHNPSLLVLASPNNPTGERLNAELVSQIAQACQSRHTVFVLDEAYVEFADSPSYVNLVPDNPNLVVVRTLSKAMGLAGVRLGYAVAGTNVVDALQIVRLPYHLSSLTQAAAGAALAHAQELLAPVELIRSERKRLSGDIRALGLKHTDSQANFVYVTGFADSHQTWQDLLDHGILVRETGPRGWLRISIGTVQENQLVIDTLQQLAKEHRL